MCVIWPLSSSSNKSSSRKREKTKKKNDVLHQRKKSERERHAHKRRNARVARENGRQAQERRWRCKRVRTEKVLITRPYFSHFLFLSAHSLKQQDTATHGKSMVKAW